MALIPSVSRYATELNTKDLTHLQSFITLKSEYKMLPHENNSVLYHFVTDVNCRATENEVPMLGFSIYTRVQITALK